MDQKPFKQQAQELIFLSPPVETVRRMVRETSGQEADAQQALWDKLSSREPGTGVEDYWRSVVGQLFQPGAEWRPWL